MTGLVFLLPLLLLAVCLVGAMFAHGHEVTTRTRRLAEMDAELQDHP